MAEVTGACPWEGGAYVTIPKSEYSLLDHGYGNMIRYAANVFLFVAPGSNSLITGQSHKKEEEHDQKRKNLTEGSHRFCRR